MVWHDPEILIPFGVAWNGAFFGILKWFFTRQVSVIDTRLAKMDDIEKRLTRVELSQDSRGPCDMYTEHLASVKALHKRIDGQNETMAEQMKMLGKIEGRTEGINRAVDLMNQFLIEQGGSKR